MSNIINQYSTIDLDNASYQAVDLNNKHNFYMIAITDLTNIQSVTFSVAIDSGVTGKPLEIQYIKLPVSAGISGTRFTYFPDEFYLKPVQIVTNDEQVIQKGEFEIEININPVDFGS